MEIGKMPMMNHFSELTYNDTLTGMKNRNYLDKYIKQEEFKNKWSVFCYMELDGLKKISDDFGPKEVDSYILSFVDRIKRSFRTTDVSIRLGESEFCIFCQYVRAYQLERRLEQIRDEFIADNQKKYPVGFSYGLIENSKDGEMFEAVMKQLNQDNNYA